MPWRHALGPAATVLVAAGAVSCASSGSADRGSRPDPCAPAVALAGTWGSDVSVLAEFTASGKVVSAWKQGRDHATILVGDQDVPQASETVCELAGSFEPPLPGSPDGVSPVYTRAVLTVGAHGASLFQVGTAETVGVIKPP